MAIIYDNYTNLGSTGTTTLTASHTTGAGPNRILFVYVAKRGAGGGSDSVTGVTYAGVAMTKIGASARIGTFNYYDHIYYLVAPAVGANNVVVSMTENDNTCGAQAVSYRGVLQNDPIVDNDLINVDTGVSISGTTTTTKKDAWAFCSVGSAGGTKSAGDAPTVAVSTSTSLYVSNAVTSPGNVTLDVNNDTNTNMAMIIFNFKPALASSGFFVLL